MTIIYLIFIPGLTVQYMCIYNCHEKHVKKGLSTTLVVFSSHGVMVNHLVIPVSTSFVEFIV
jgi:hypothetical protein